ncbi:MAG: hypothetical protein HY819_16465 [Acidobacteria bacterium]|nr:hypothetical protein [Acidobacteriota bacterium]
MRKLFICIFLALFLTACDDTRSLETTPTPTPTNTSETNLKNNSDFIQGDFSEKKAMEFLYSNYNEAQKESNWNPTQEDLLKVDEDSSLKEAKEFYVTALLTSPFKEEGSDKQILITAAAPPEHTCHACAPIIGAFIFKKNTQGWELELKQHYVTELGSYGAPPDGKLVQIGKDNFGVLFDFGDTGQGYTTESVVLIAKTDKAFKEILTVETGGDNSGTCGDDLGPCWEFSSKYEFVSGKNENFFDFKISTTGTKGGDEENTTVPVNENKTYIFDGKEYKSRQ